jgi:hypothetical protein
MGSRRQRCASSTGAGAGGLRSRCVIKCHQWRVPRPPGQAGEPVGLPARGRASILPNRADSAATSSRAWSMEAHASTTESFFTAVSDATNGQATATKTNDDDVVHLSPPRLSPHWPFPGGHNAQEAQHGEIGKETPVSKDKRHDTPLLLTLRTCHHPAGGPAMT